MAWSLQNLRQRGGDTPLNKEGSTMGFLMEVDVDEFLELMECETEARLRVAEIMERRRRAKASSDLVRSEDTTTH
jgi:hypothetical protein